MTNMNQAEITEIVNRCKFELATNFECPSKRILGVYGSKLGMTGEQMFDFIAPKN